MVYEIIPIQLGNIPYIPNLNDFSLLTLAFVETKLSPEQKPPDAAHSVMSREEPEMTMFPIGNDVYKGVLY